VKGNFQFNIRKACWPCLGSGLFFCLYLYISPYISLSRCSTSIKEKNVANVSRCIDFTELRSNLKERLRENIERKLLINQIEQPLAPLRILIVNKLIDGMVDVIIRPSSLKTIFATGEIRMQQEKNTVREQLGSPHLYTKSQRPHSTYTYHSFNKFTLDLQSDQFSQPIRFRWKRESLATWRLYDIELPSMLFAGT